MNETRKDVGALAFCCSDGACAANELYNATAGIAAASDHGTNCTAAVETAAAAGSGALLLAGADGSVPALTDGMVGMLAANRFRIFAEQPTLPPRIETVGRLDARPCVPFARLVARAGSPLWSNASCAANRTLRGRSSSSSPTCAPSRRT